MWEKHADFKPFLTNAWEEREKATSMQQLHQKLTDVSGSLEDWGKTTFGHVQREIRQLNERLTVLRADVSRQEPTSEETVVHQRLLELYQREEVMWRQRSRVQWLAEGDRNTRSFSFTG
jgi:uncharacterized coiled-coil DUF342 family protein